MTELTTTLKLKEVVYRLDGKPAKDYDAVEKLRTDGSMKQPNETEKEAPVITKGILLSNILFVGVKPDNPVESAQLNRLAKKVRNVMNTGKGEWIVTKKDITEIIDLFQKIPKETLMAGNVGEVMVMLEDALSDIANQEIIQRTKK